MYVHTSTKLYTRKVLTYVVNADGLSRLPLPSPLSQEVPVPSEYVLLFEHLACGPITTTQIKTITRQDRDLSKVLYYVQKE